MTIDALTINGKDLSELDSKQTTELITALFTHRKQLNEDKRLANAAAKKDRAKKAAERKAARIAKLEAQLKAAKTPKATKPKAKATA
jgi:predicted phage-related endonuclease